MFSSLSKVCVLFLEVSPKYVDVNVHPTKAEVRFFDQQSVRSLIVGSIRQALLQGDNKTSTTSSSSFLDFLSNKTHTLLKEENTPFSSTYILEDLPSSNHNQSPNFTPSHHSFFQSSLPQYSSSKRSGCNFSSKVNILSGRSWLVFGHCIRILFRYDNPHY